ncbi:MAG: HMA2 domain-containing protein [Thermodesulfobacteriota bacterium]
MKPYIHNVPGRLRVKIPGLKGDPKRGRKAAELIEAMDGIDTVKVTPLTGSVIVYYDPDTAIPSRILDALEANGYFERTEQKTSPVRTAFEQKVSTEAVFRKVLHWMVEKALERSGQALLAALI